MEGLWTKRLFFCAFAITLTLWTYEEIYRLRDADSAALTVFDLRVGWMRTPFPAITVCPPIKFRNLTFSEILDPVLLDLPENFTYTECKEVEEIKNPANIISALKSVAPKLEDVVHSCEWQNSLINCSDVFQEVPTDEGICFSAYMVKLDELLKVVPNGLHKSNITKMKKWSEYGFPLYAGDPDDYHKTYPPVLTPEAPNHQFSFVIRSITQNETSYCNIPQHGYKLHIHSPFQVPYLDKGYMRIPGHKGLDIQVKPRSIFMGRNDDSTRFCRQPFNKSLEYFRIYNQLHCEFECLTKRVLKTCGCRTFFMPYTNASAPICDTTLKAKECIKSVIRDLENSQNHTEGCDCLPACARHYFDLEVSTDDFMWRGAKIRSKVLDTEVDNPSYRTSRVSITLKPLLGHATYETRKHHVFIRENYSLLGDDVILAVTGFMFLVVTLLIYHSHLRTSPSPPPVAMSSLLAIND